MNAIALSLVLSACGHDSFPIREWGSSQLGAYSEERYARYQRIAATHPDPEVRFRIGRWLNEYVERFVYSLLPVDCPTWPKILDAPGFQTVWWDGQFRQDVPTVFGNLHDAYPEYYSLGAALSYGAVPAHRYAMKCEAIRLLRHTGDTEYVRTLLLFAWWTERLGYQAEIDGSGFAVAVRGDATEIYDKSWVSDLVKYTPELVNYKCVGGWLRSPNPDRPSLEYKPNEPDE